MVFLLSFTVVVNFVVNTVVDLMQNQFDGVDAPPRPTPRLTHCPTTCVVSPYPYGLNHPLSYHRHKFFRRRFRGENYIYSSLLSYATPNTIAMDYNVSTGRVATGVGMRRQSDPIFELKLGKEFHLEVSIANFANFSNFSKFL